MPHKKKPSVPKSLKKKAGKSLRRTARKPSKPDRLGSTFGQSRRSARAILEQYLPKKKKKKPQLKLSRKPKAKSTKPKKVSRAKGPLRLQRTKRRK